MSPPKNKKAKDKSSHSNLKEEKCRSKFNLKLEKISSSPTSRTLSAAGASIKSLFHRKKSQKENKASASSFINPIPIVAASCHNGLHITNASLAEEMREKPTETETTTSCYDSSRSPSPRPPHPHERVVLAPRMLPPDRIAFGYKQDPNFQLQGAAPPYSGKKLIFRPSPYAPGPRHCSPNYPVSLGMRFAGPPSPRFARAPDETYTAAHFQYHRNVSSLPSSNFPNHHPNLLRQPLAGSAFVNNSNYQHAMSSSSPNSTHLRPPVPKQRMSLMRQGRVASSEEIHKGTCNNEPPRIIVPNDRRLPRVAVSIKGIRDGEKQMSQSCADLSLKSTGLCDNGSNVIRKYSSQSRVSCATSHSDFGGSRNSVPWFRWFASRLEKEGQIKGRGLARQSEGDNPNCIRCNKKLPNASKGLKGAIVAPVACSICSLKVCKSCAVLDQSKNSYSCGHCHPPKSIDKRRSFWFETLSPGVGTSFVAAEQDSTQELTREHLERIIEAHIDEGIDSVSLARLYNHPQYEIVFHRFHDELSDALVNLGYSLKLAIENKPLPTNETPTSAHAALTDLLSDIRDVAMELPLMEPADKSEIPPDMSTKEGPTVQPSYEDVLATAVLNKAIQNGQKSKRKADSPMSLVDSAVQTDSEMSESSEAVSHKQYKDVRGWVTNLGKSSPQQHPNISDDDLSMGTSSSNWSNEGNNLKPNQQVVIEEQVEEITTTYESDSDISRHPPSRSKKGRKSAKQRNAELSNNTSAPAVQDDTLFGVDLNSFETRVPFPEGGVEIVPRSKLEADEEEEDPTGILVSQISEWEQNWLFKRRKQLLRRRNLMAESVPMLVPNPNEDEIGPQIGDDKVSDLSDLSDHVDDHFDEGHSHSDDFHSSEQSAGEENDEQLESAEPKVAPAIKLDAHPAQKKVEDPITEQIRKESNASIASKASAQSSEAGSETQNGFVPKKKSSQGFIMLPRRESAAKPIDTIKFLQVPKDSNALRGKTARFCCVVSEDSPDFSVAWFNDGSLVTTSAGKSWVYSSDKCHHYLYIYDSRETDAGKYSLALFDFKGNEKKISFNLTVDDQHREKPEPPNFTLLQDTVKASKLATVVNIPFEVTGYPEPFLQVFRNDVEISKLSHVLLEDKGEGKWNLELRKSESGFSVYGEYVAVLKSSQGVTRVTFAVKEGEGQEEPPVVKVERKIVQQDPVSNGTKPRRTFETYEKSPSPAPRAFSVESQDSSIEDHDREQYHTLNRNQTRAKEDFEDSFSDGNSQTFDPSNMRIAEREKMKWMHPVNLPNNPYAPENLAKRIRDRESGNFHVAPNSTSDMQGNTSDDEQNPVVERKQNLSKFARDYYVHGVSSQSSSLKSFSTAGKPPSRSPSLVSTSSKEGSQDKEIKIQTPKANLKEDKPQEFVQHPQINVPLPKSKTSEVDDHGSTRGKSPNLLDPSRTPSPHSTSSRTPSPRPRRHRSDLGSLGASKTAMLPSVKKLAQVFQTSDEKNQPAEPKPATRLPPRVFQPKENKNYQQVHSLTARSVSKQFREGLKQAQPNPVDINIKLKPTMQQNHNNNNKESSIRLSESTREKYNSNDSLASSNSDISGKFDTSGELCRKKGGSSSNILARAAFWDKRIQEEILDDEVVIKEFPKMEI